MTPKLVTHNTLYLNVYIGHLDLVPPYQIRITICFLNSYTLLLPKLNLFNTMELLNKLLNKTNFL